MDYVTKHHLICHHRAMIHSYGKATQKDIDIKNTGGMGPGEGVLELPIVGEPGNRITPLRKSGIQFPGN